MTSQHYQGFYNSRKGIFVLLTNKLIFHWVIISSNQFCIFDAAFRIITFLFYIYIETKYLSTNILSAQCMTSHTHTHMHAHTLFLETLYVVLYIASHYKLLTYFFIEK